MPAHWAIWRCNAPSQSSRPSASVLSSILIDEIVHALDIGGLGAHGGKLGELRLDAQTHFHDFHEIGTGDDRADMLAPAVGAPAGKGAGSLAPPDKALGFQHFESAAHGTAADAEDLRKRALRRQLAVGIEALGAQQRPKLVQSKV